MTNPSSNTGLVLVLRSRGASQEALTNILAKLAFETRCVEKVSQVDAAVDAQPPDVLLLDASLLGEDVSRLTRFASSSFPVLIFGERITPEEKARWFDAGCADIISSPWVEAEIFTKLQNFVQIRHFRQVEHDYDLLTRYSLIMEAASQEYAKTFSSRKYLQMVCKVFVELVNAKLVWAGEIAGEFSDVLLPVAAFGQNADKLPMHPIALGKSGNAVEAGLFEVVESRAPKIFQDLSDSAWTQMDLVLEECEILAVPLESRGKVVAVLHLYESIRENHDKKELDLLLRLCGKLGNAVNALRNLERQKGIEKQLQNYSANLEERVIRRTRELRQTQEELLRQERLTVLGRLAQRMAHEMRNPLGVISNAAYFIKMVTPNDKTRVIEYLGFIQDEVKSAMQILTDLLDFSAPPTGDREWVAIPGLLTSVLQEHPVPEEIKVIQDYPDVLPKIYLDRRQMGYVIYQVIKNAVDAVMDKQVQTRPPLITISADQTASHVYLHIRDNGVGIPAKQLPDVFEPLRSTKSRGIGLGLAIAKRMMEANNAEIILESTENEGTTAIIKLPIVKE